MNDEDKIENLLDDAVTAFEDSTGELPNDYEMSVMKIGAREIVEGQQ